MWVIFFKTHVQNVYELKDKLLFSLELQEIESFLEWTLTMI